MDEDIGDGTTSCFVRIKSDSGEQLLKIKETFNLFSLAHISFVSQYLS